MAKGRKTQADVAAVLGISQQGVSRRLAGQVAFDVVELYLVADMLGVEIAELLPVTAVA